MSGSPTPECARFRVTGRVQGVFFRDSTRATAQRLGITGWVRNLPDGAVEVLACGEPAALDGLEEWLWRGPDQARVEDVARRPADDPPPPAFSVR